MPAKKTTTKATAGKATTKKSATGKVTTKKAPAKKATAKRATTKAATKKAGGSDRQPRPRSPLTPPVGHDAAFAEVRRAIEEDRFAHAWLITGPRGIGKAHFALHVARFLLGGEAALSDDKNSDVQLLAARTHPDFYFIDSVDRDGVRKTAISIEKIRELNQMLRLTPARDGWRVALIDSADMLSRNAANALLKILEEPPRRVAFLLPCERVGGVPVTLVSRCRRLRLRPLGRDDFCDVFGSANSDVDRGDLELLYLLSRGSPGEAEVLMELGGARLYRELVETLLCLGEAGGPARYHRFAAELGGERNRESWVLFPRLLEGILRRSLRARAGGDSEPVLEEERELFAGVETPALLEALRWVMEEMPLVERRHLGRVEASVAAFTRLAALTN